mgnify:CR=1 FL=1
MDDSYVTRAHLKHAVDTESWDLLDKLLEIDPGRIDDNSLYTDTWGEWWGLLFECVRKGRVTGVRVLLKHGADPSVGNWGDCIPMTPMEAAEDNPEILSLLLAGKRPNYERTSDPPLPEGESAADRAIRRQGEVAEQTGLVFNSDVFAEED